MIIYIRKNNKKNSIYPLIKLKSFLEKNRFGKNLITVFIYRFIKKLYLNHFLYFSTSCSKNKTILRLSEYINQEKLNKNYILKNEIINFPNVKIISTDPFFKINITNDFVFPEIYSTEVKSATVIGGTNFVLTQNKVLIHDLLDLKYDYTREEMHGLFKINIKNMTIKIISCEEIYKKIDRAASFVDALSVNYAHWITEILPKINIFLKIEKFKKIPIIVNDQLNENIMSSLMTILDKDRQIFLLQDGINIEVNSLVLISTVGYVPFEPRFKEVLPLNHGRFSHYALSALRETVINKNNKLDCQKSYKKIYLKRNSKTRNLINKIEVEKFLLENGFHIVECENLSFQKQFEIFSSAKVIIGPTGSAFANCIFCAKDTKIGIMIDKNERMLYGYWPSIINSINKNNLVYILGSNEIKSIKGRDVHSNFHVSLESIKEFLNKTI